MRPQRSKHASPALRALIIGYRLHFAQSWQEISNKLDVAPSTARAVYRRVEKLASGPDWTEMLKHLESAPREGRPQTTAESVSASTAWRRKKRAKAEKASRKRPADSTNSSSTAIGPESDANLSHAPDSTAPTGDSTADIRPGSVPASSYHASNTESMDPLGD